MTPCRLSCWDETCCSSCVREAELAAMCAAASRSEATPGTSCRVHPGTCEQLGHVPGEEARLIRCGCGGERPVELGERVFAALGMGVVGREHEQLSARLFDHPPDRLSGKWRELEVPSDVFRGQLCEFAQGPFGTAEGARRVVQMAQPGHDPGGPLFDAAAAQLRKAIEQAVEDDRPEEYLGRLVNREEVLRANVLATT